MFSSFINPAIAKEQKKENRNNLSVGLMRVAVYVFF